MNPIGAENALYPMPTTLVGVTVNEKPNFLAVAHVGILNHGTPRYLSTGLGKVHYSNAGIHENRTFSICLPSEDLKADTHRFKREPAHPEPGRVCQGHGVRC